MSNARRCAPLMLLFLLLLLPQALRAQWKKLSVFPGTFFNEVFFIDNNHGWITGHSGTIVRTADGGTSWQVSSLPGATGSFNRDICFVSQNNGFISGDDGIWKTTNGGATWLNITPPGQVSGNSSHWFVDANNGVYGFGPCNADTVRFYRTSDGGATWDSVKYASAVDVAVGGICYYSGTYYAGGGVGKLWRSTDNGATWTPGSTNSAGFHEDAVAAPGGTIHMPSVDGSVCGVSGSSKMARSLDGGNTWTNIPFPGVIMWGVTFYSPSEGWCCADNAHAYLTTDGGATWTEKSCGLSRLDRLDDICFTDQTHGWAVGDGIYKYVGDGYNARPDTIDFGDIIVGTASADSSAIITALGSPITVSNRVLTGLNPLDFQPTSGLGPQNVASCQDAATLVRFRPTSEGVKIARLDFTLAGFPDSVRVFLKGRGVKPKINSARALNFDTLVCGNTVTDTLFVSNTGTTALKISSASVLVPAGATFQLMFPVLPATIGVGDSVGFIIRLTAPTPGPVLGTLSIINNDPDTGKSPWVVALNGYRRQIAVAMDRDTLVVIPPAPFGVLSNACVTYRNMGDGMQIIDSVSPASNDAVINHYPAAGGTRVARGGTQTLCFTASATDTTLHVRRFRVRTQPCGLDTFITVRYRAANPVISSAPALTIVSGACDSLAADTLVITNKGNLPLVINTPVLGGPDRLQFKVISPASWPDTVLPGGTLKVAIQALFTGPAAGVRTATVTFPNNDGIPGKNLWRVDLAAQQGSSELTLNRHVIDIGTICVGDARSEIVMLRNIGTAPAVLRGVTPLDSSAAVAVTPTMPATLAPNVLDSLVLGIQTLAGGPFQVRYLVQYDPCDRLDTIVLRGTAVQVRIDAPPLIDFGGAQVGRKVQRTYQLTNTGTAATTLTAWDLQPPTAGVVVNPALPLVVGPGASVPVVVELTPADTGVVRLTLGAVATTPCPDTARTVITAFGVKGAVLASQLAIDLGSVVACTDDAIADSVVLNNVGVLPIDLLTARLADGSAVKLPGGFTAPYTIAPGGSLVVPITIPAGTYGTIADTLVLTLDQPDDPVLRIPIVVRRERAALLVQDAVGIATDTLNFGVMSRCDTLRPGMLRLSNPGTVDDSVTITIEGQPFRYTGATALTLAPGQAADVPIAALMTANGTAVGTATFRWQPCGLERRVVLVADYHTFSARLADLDIGNHYLNTTADTVAQLVNTGTAPIEVDTILVADPTAGFEVVGDYRGSIVPPGESLAVALHFTAAKAGPAATTLVVRTVTPCTDLAPGMLAAMVLRDRIDTLAVLAGETRGRWGTTVTVPIAFANDGGSGVRSMELSVTASPILLNPTAERLNVAASQSGWTLKRLGYDAALGTLRLLIEAPATAPIIESVDDLVAISYEVLRGDAVASPVQPVLSALPANIVAQSRAGSFALEDYCDAYGRLLRVQGNVALDQNVPNPFNPTTTIEFETAFSGHVLLALYDAGGHEVARLVDEQLPAGRRRVVVDASRLPSGVYTYRMRSGLQIISRRMVVTK